MEHYHPWKDSFIKYEGDSFINIQKKKTKKTIVQETSPCVLDVESMWQGLGKGGCAKECGTLPPFHFKVMQRREFYPCWKTNFANQVDMHLL